MRIDRKEIERVVAESEDLITALEAVGAMYCIPPTHILQDDSQQSIKVINDTIIAPNRKNTIGNTQSIVCAIGSVLDYISQRVDDKLNDFQSNSIEKSKFDHAANTADPNKGKVVGRYTSDDDEEIIVYDSGIVDRPLTRSAIMKVADLKRNGLIPDKKDIIQEKPKSTYFSDSDDITSDVNMDPNTVELPDTPETDVSDSIGESANILDLISEYNNSINLGYDIFSEMGFNIKPNDEYIIQEAAKFKKSKSKQVKPGDIKHMKFDNTHILKAVKYFNAARAEQKEVKFAKDINIQKLINNPNYTKGVKELEEQFDCHLAYKFTKNDEGYENAGTLTIDPKHSYAHDITISKSKGFQLHGAGIFIIVDEYGLFSDAPIDQSMFGQAFVAVSLHEIFHNIANLIRAKSDAFIINTATTVTLLASARSAKRKREILNRYCDAIQDSGIFDVKSPIKRKIFIKQMMLLSSIQDPGELKSVIDKTSDIKTESEIDDTIKAYASVLARKKKAINASRAYKHHGWLSLIGFALGIIGGTAVTIPALAVGGYTFGIWEFFAYIAKKLFNSTYEEFEKQYAKGRAFEESWCDMFAGIYNFPVVFYIKSANSKNKNFTPNTVGNIEKLNELAKLEKELHTLLFTTYPSNSERNHAAAKLAENALKDKHLDAATKKYLTWIKDNFSAMLETDIEKEDVNTTYDPNRAGDVDKHIQDIINQGNVAVTESFI